MSAVTRNDSAPDPLLDFRWSQIESADLGQYARNLRSFGVPERTVRDLILAEVHRLYRPRLVPFLRGNPIIKTNFWENSRFGAPANSNLTADQRAELRALQREEKELVQSLLGKDVYEQMTRESGLPDATEMTLGPLRQDKRDVIAEMRQRFWDARSEVYAKAGDYSDQDTMAEIRTLETKFHAELATILTPDQLFEYELRSSDLANNLKFRLDAFEPSEQEYRAVFQYQQAMDGVNRGTPETRRDAQRAFEEALGPDRLKEYHLLEDSSYQNLAMSGVTREAILKLAETKSQAEQAAAAIRQDKTLTPEQRTQSLQALRSTSENTLADLLGQRRARYYVNASGYWLRNIAPSDQAPGFSQ